MTEPPVSLAALSDADKTRLSQLTTIPLLAWPAALVYCLVITVYAGASYLALRGAIPLWAATVANSLAGYWIFTTGHDGVHRTLSRNERVNEFIAQSSLWLLGPQVNLGLFRWCHFLHHRFANGPRDPDHFFNGAWWTLPLRWLVVDIYYGVYVFRHGDRSSREFLRNALVAAVFTVAAAAWLTWTGHGMQVLMLWFIPSRIAFGLMGFSFFWLPHVPHDVSQQENFTRATTVRVGYEKLMNILLQSHHVHLIHHLYPATPSHNNGRIWRLIEPELRKKDLAIQRGFAIQPVIQRGGVTST